MIASSTRWALLVAAATALVSPLLALQTQGRPGAQAVPSLTGIPGLRGALGAGGDTDSGLDAEVQVHGVASRNRVIPGDPLPIAVIFSFKPGWHIWTSATQAASLPKSFARFGGAIYTAIDLADPVPGLDVATGFIQWPEFHAITADLGDGPQSFAFYEGHAVAYLPVIVAADAAPGARTIKLTVSFQACNEKGCIAPEDVDVEIPLEVFATAESLAQAAAAGAGASGSARGGTGAGSGGSAGADAALFASFDPSVFGRILSGEAGASSDPLVGGGVGDDGLVHFNLFVVQFDVDPDGLGMVILVALMFVGGLLLNLTPCVLPIIPLKIIGLTQTAGSRARSVLLGGVMSLGVLSFFLTLGLAMAILKIDAVNIIFQYPIVTLLIGAFIVVMAVAMSGFFSLHLPDFIYAFEPKHETLKGSFFVGIITAVLSTPCSGPFVFSAVSYALKVDSRPMIIGMFTAMGAGMALPYLVLSAFPALVKHVPKAGPASELVKQVMSLLLAAAGVLFISTALAGIFHWRSYEYYWVVAGVAGIAGAWLLYRTFRITKRTGPRLTFGSLGALIVLASILGGRVMSAQDTRLDWALYSPQAEALAREKGQVVVMKFTAHWCISCKVLEKAMLTSDAVTDRLSQPDVTLITVDITGGEPDQKRRLREAGSATIPLLLVYAPDGSLMLRSDAYTGQQVIDAVNAAAERATMAKR